MGIKDWPPWGVLLLAVLLASGSTPWDLLGLSHNPGPPSSSAAGSCPTWNLTNANGSGIVYASDWPAFIPCTDAATPQVQHGHSNGSAGDCSDGLDGDGDGLIDWADPDCLIIDLAPPGSSGYSGAAVQAATPPPYGSYCDRVGWMTDGYEGDNFANYSYPAVPYGQFNSAQGLQWPGFIAYGRPGHFTEWVPTSPLIAQYCVGWVDASGNLWGHP